MLLLLDHVRRARIAVHDPWRHDPPTVRTHSGLLCRSSQVSFGKPIRRTNLSSPLARELVCCPQNNPKLKAAPTWNPNYEASPFAALLSDASRQVLSNYRPLFGTVLRNQLSDALVLLHRKSTLLHLRSHVPARKLRTSVSSCQVLAT
jgi:hypothetical protein